MSLNLFGSGYNTVGSSNSNFIIKTKGKVKIQWGSKYIDLIKDGKINVDSKFIFKEKEVGVKDGIYVIGDGDDAKVVISIGGSQIDLKGEIGTTYVSFLGEQETTSEQKYTALQNIGFIYKDLSAVQTNGLQNGIVYIESNQKLYIVQDGQLTEFTVDFPNPFTNQFIIAKTDSNKGALVIKGQGQENSLMFDSLSIYSSGLDNYIDSSGQIFVRIGETEKVIIGDSQAIFSNTVVSQKFQSRAASDTSGFRLYVDAGGSTLEVDNLTVRNGIPTDSPVVNTYPKYWYKENNIISSVSQVSNQDDTEDTDDSGNTEQTDVSEQIEFAITLIYTNKFKVNDSLYVYVPVTETEKLGEELIILPVKVESLDTEKDNIIYVSLQQDKMSEEDYQKLISQPGNYEALEYQTIFLAGSEEEISILRRNSDNIDLLKSTSFDDEQNLAKVSTRIGNIQELDLKGKESDEEVSIEGTGIYSDNGCFLKAQYTSNYDLPKTDSSTKFASTEWINSLIPKGSIIMFNGASSEIPEGWHICDGTEGTPNLIGKFIKADTSSGTEGGKSEIEILEENMPRHTHTFTESTIKTSEAGAHTHTFQGKYGKSSNTDEADVIMAGSETDLITTSSSEAHTHTIDVSNTQLSYQGGGRPIKWEPSYYSLIYIMKIK